MFGNIPDNYSQWEAHEYSASKQLALRPKCDYCEEPIQDDFYYQIDCEKVCEECLQLHFRKAVEENEP